MDLRAYLEQGDVWYVAPIAGQDPTGAIKIGSMTKDHRQKSARWLMQKSTPMIAVIEGTVNEGVVSGDGDQLRDVLSLIAQDPRSWMWDRPIFQSLIKGLNEDDMIDWLWQGRVPAWFRHGLRRN